MKKTFILLVLLFGHQSTLVAEEVDYSKCEKMLDMGNAALPFFFKGNGKMEMGSLKPGRISYNHHKSKKQDVFNRVSWLATPAIYSGKFNPKEWGNEKNWKKVNITTVVQRNNEGGVESIYKDFPQQYIDQQIRLKQHLYNSHVGADLREGYKEWGQGFEAEKYNISRSTVRFEIKNGQCVPMEAKDTILLGRSKDAKSFEATVFNTKLCKDIHDFFEKNPKAKSCFNIPINKKMASILNKHIGSKEKEYAKDMGDYKERAKPILPGFENLYSSFFNGNDYMANQMVRKNYYSSNSYMREYSIMAAHNILRSCYIYGLRPFIEDGSLWQDNSSKEMGARGKSKDLQK